MGFFSAMSTGMKVISTVITIGLLAGLIYLIIYLVDYLSSDSTKKKDDEEETTSTTSSATTSSSSSTVDVSSLTRLSTNPLSEEEQLVIEFQNSLRELLSSGSKFSNVLQSNDNIEYSYTFDDINTESLDIPVSCLNKNVDEAMYFEVTFENDTDHPTTTFTEGIRITPYDGSSSTSTDLYFSRLNGNGTFRRNINETGDTQQLSDKVCDLQVYPLTIGFLVGVDGVVKLIEDSDLYITTAVNENLADITTCFIQPICSSDGDGEVTKNYSINIGQRDWVKDPLTSGGAVKTTTLRAFNGKVIGTF